jgi:hypothetical protein
MAGRSELQKSPAFAALSDSGKRVLQVIEQAGRGAVAISLEQFMDADMRRSAARYGIRQCEELGLIAVTMGPRRVNQFALADGWRDLETAGEAARLVKLARLPTPPRASSAPPRAVKQAKARVEVEQPPTVRQVPSMPTVAWIGDGR